MKAIQIEARVAPSFIETHQFRDPDKVGLGLAEWLRKAQVGESLLISIIDDPQIDAEGKENDG